MNDTMERLRGGWHTVVDLWRAGMRHWRGEYPVGQAFWFNYLAVSTCLLLIEVWCLIIAWYVGYADWRDLLIGCVVVQVCVWIWGIVGAYRAAVQDVGGFIRALRRMSAKTFLVINILAALAGGVIVGYLYHTIVTSFHP